MPTKCKNCGASDFVRKGDKYVCQYCGTEYPISAEELAKEKQANAKASWNTSSRSQNSPTSHSTDKTGYVDASIKKPPKKRLSRNSQIVIGVIIVAALFCIYAAVSDSGSNDEADNATVTVETEAVKAKEQTEVSATKRETRATNVKAQKTNEPSSVINDFDYDLSGNEVMLQSYKGNNNILEIYPSYTIDGKTYTTNLSDFQVREDSVKTLILDEGITEVNKSIFNSSEVEKIFFPKTMTFVYDYTLAYLHPDENEPIQIYYAGSQEEWDEIFTEYTNIGDTDDSKAELVGEAAADFLNGFFGMEYDSSEFEYFFNASPDDVYS